MAFLRMITRVDFLEQDQHLNLRVSRYNVGCFDQYAHLFPHFDSRLNLFFEDFPIQIQSFFEWIERTDQIVNIRMYCTYCYISAIQIFL